MPPCPCALAVCLCAAGLVRAEQQTPPAPPDAEMSSAIEEFKIGWGGKRCCQFPADHYVALLYHRRAAGRRSGQLSNEGAMSDRYRARSANWAGERIVEGKTL